MPCVFCMKHVCMYHGQFYFGCEECMNSERTDECMCEGGRRICFECWKTQKMRRFADCNENYRDEMVGALNAGTQLADWCLCEHCGEFHDGKRQIPRGKPCATCRLRGIA